MYIFRFIYNGVNLLFVETEFLTEFLFHTLLNDMNIRTILCSLSHVGANKRIEQKQHEVIHTLGLMKMYVCIMEKEKRLSFTILLLSIAILTRIRMSHSRRKYETNYARFIFLSHLPSNQICVIQQFIFFKINLETC